MELSRRSLITGLVSLVAAPAIVRASSLMPVKPYDVELTGFGLAPLKVEGGWVAYEHEDRFYSFKGSGMRALICQIELGDKDEIGHPLTNNVHFIKAKESIR